MSARPRRDCARRFPKSTDIPTPLILDWANIADLTRVSGIAIEYAELLVAAGVDTVKDLSRRNAANLVARMTEINRRKQRVRVLPSEKRVAQLDREGEEALPRHGLLGAEAAPALPRAAGGHTSGGMADAEPQSAAVATPGIEDWRKLVEKALKGRDPESLSSRTRDGIAIEPLYARRRDVRTAPRTRPAARGRSCKPVDDPDPDRANAQALDDLAGGATGLSLRFAGSPTGGGFGLPASEAALAAALDGVDLAKAQLETRAACRRSPFGGLASDAGREKRRRAGADQDRLRARPGGGSQRRRAADAKEFAAALHGASRARFRGPLATLDARPYHEAGASEAQELAGVLAAAAWWLRALVDSGDGSDRRPAPSSARRSLSIATCFCRSPSCARCDCSGRGFRSFAARRQRRFTCTPRRAGAC